MPQTRIIASLTLQTMNDEQGSRCDDLRNKAIELAEVIKKTCEDSPEKSLAYTNLEQSLMWAIKSIALEVTQKE